VSSPSRESCPFSKSKPKASEIFIFFAITVRALGSGQRVIRTYDRVNVYIDKYLKELDYKQ